MSEKKTKERKRNFRKEIEKYKKEKAAAFDEVILSIQSLSLLERMFYAYLITFKRYKVKGEK